MKTLGVLLLLWAVPVSAQLIRPDVKMCVPNYAITATVGVYAYPAGSTLPQDEPGSVPPGVGFQEVVPPPQRTPVPAGVVCPDNTQDGYVVVGSTAGLLPTMGEARTLVAWSRSATGIRSTRSNMLVQAVPLQPAPLLLP